MSDRIIDQTEKLTIDGTESIPGTEQVSDLETTPKNKRWTFNTIKTWITTYIKNLFITNGNCFEWHTITFTEADYYEFEPDQYDYVFMIFFEPILATTIKVGSLSDSEAYVSETSNKANNIGVYCDSSLSLERNMNITLNGSGVVKIMSFKVP